MEKIFNWVSIVFGAAGGFLSGILGGWDKWLAALIVFVCLDFATGVAKGIFQHRLASAICFKGIVKKVFIFVVVAIGVVLQGLIGNTLPLRDMVVCFYVANEGISVLENIAEFIPLPAKLKEVLLQIREKSEASETEDSE